MATSSDFVSVIMPVYNGEDYVYQAAKSILSQTYRNFEFLILDDGSSDNSPNILKGLEAEDSRVKLITRENRGLVVSLNELIDRSAGTLIARMDADDIALPARLEKQVEFMQSNPGVGVVGSAIWVIDGSDRPIFKAGRPLSHDEIDTSNLAGSAALCHPATMLRRDVLKKVGGYCTTYETTQDLDLWLRLAEHSSMANLSDALLLYRHHPGSVSSKAQELQAKNTRRACFSAYERRGLDEKLFSYKKPRPTGEKESEVKFLVTCAWQAYGSGFFSTARHYAWQTLLIAPGRVDAWKILVLSHMKNDNNLEFQDLIRELDATCFRKA